MNVRFEPGARLRGELRPPSDKSLSHRAALLAAMSAEPVSIRNYLDSADTNATLATVQALGALVERRADEVLVRGTGLHGLEPPTGPLWVGNSGTLMRLLPGWLAAQEGMVFALDGDESIRSRPVDRIAEPLRRMGATVEARDGRLPPFTVAGARLRGIEYQMPVASGQVKSCTLLAGLEAAGETTVVEPAPSRDHTERMLLRAGATVTRAGARITVRPADELELGHVEVPGDLSSAAFLIAAALLVPGSRVLLRDVGVNWTRAGFLSVLERMQAIVLAEREPAGTPLTGEEPVAELDVAAGPLVATVVEDAEIPLTIDELPLVALLGCFAEGETVVRDAAELRVKETDRIAAVVDGLRGLGADIEATQDGFAVRGSAEGLRGGVLDSRGDHRLAMLGAVAGLASREGVEVVGMEAAAVSYPGFEADVTALTDA